MAVLRPKLRMATWKIGKHVRAAKREFELRMMRAEVLLKMPKTLKMAAKIGIDRCHPGGGAGLQVKRITVAVALGDGAGDASGFEAEPQMILIFIPRAVIEEADGHEAQGQGDKRDYCRRLPKMFSLDCESGYGAHDLG